MESQLLGAYIDKLKAKYDAEVSSGIVNAIKLDAAVNELAELREKVKRIDELEGDLASLKKELATERRLLVEKRDELETERAQRAKREAVLDAEIRRLTNDNAVVGGALTDARNELERLKSGQPAVTQSKKR
jgi:septal ring factor EnvC (AmiA/AmiB activator)